MWSTPPLFCPLYVILKLQYTRRWFKMIETWKNLKGIIDNGDNYAVNPQGQVKNVLTEKLLKPTCNGNGYLGVALSLNGKVKRHLLHRVVAKAFIPNPEGLPEVNHLDGDKSNCAVRNLEWTTRSRNQQHAVNTGLQKTKVTKEDVIRVKQALLKGRSQHKISKELNIPRTTIASIQYGRTWKEVYVPGFSPFVKPTKGSGRQSSKLDEDKVRKMRDLHATGNYTYAELGTMFGVSSRNASDVVQYKLWKHVN
ncbi:putative HNH endonuclease [Bacillus phage BSP14]|nr:putative HNH endonuclease [Bacillus phage BSP14]